MKLNAIKMVPPLLTGLLLAACGGSGVEGTADADQPAQAGLRVAHLRGAGETRSAPEPTAESSAASTVGLAAELSVTGEPGGATARGPAASAANAARPFPYHATYTAGVIKPSNVSQAAMDSKVQSYYNTWKSSYLRTSGGQGTWVKYDGSNTTVSEAHGYGMVLAAYLADKNTFDSLYGYYKAHPSTNAAHLMAWKQTLSGGKMKNIEGADSATDGDLDIAYGLLLADTQWGSHGSINYKEAALATMRDILAHEVNASHGNLTPGDWASGSDTVHTRPSDFMTDHFLAFAKADSANAAKWDNVYRTVSHIVNYQYAHGSANTGLLPDFMVASGSNFVPVSGTYLETGHDGDFDYNACRTPWRLAMSYIVNGKTDMLAAQQKTASWIKAKTGGTPNKVRAGYYIKNGGNGNAYVNYDDLSFTAPLAVNAMLGGAGGQAWLNSLWSSIAGGDYGSKVDYYGDTIRLQVMLTVSGNWWTP